MNQSMQHYLLSAVVTLCLAGVANAQLTLELELSNQAVQCERFGKTKEAEALYRRVVELNAKNQQAQHRLGVLTAARGEYGQAIDHFRAAEKSGPPSAQLLNDYGAALYLNDRLSTAEKKLQTALTLDPNSLDARNNLNLVLSKQKQRFATSANGRMVADGLADAESASRIHAAAKARAEAESKAAAEAIAQARAAKHLRAIAEARAAHEAQATARAIARARAASKLRGIAEKQAEEKEAAAKRESNEHTASSSTPPRAPEPKTESAGSPRRITVDPNAATSPASEHKPNSARRVSIPNKSVSPRKEATAKKKPVTNTGLARKSPPPPPAPFNPGRKTNLPQPSGPTEKNSTSKKFVLNNPILAADQKSNVATSPAKPAPSPSQALRLAKKLDNDSKPNPAPSAHSGKPTAMSELLEAATYAPTVMKKTDLRKKSPSHSAHWTFEKRNSQSSALTPQIKPPTAPHRPITAKLLPASEGPSPAPRSSFKRQYETSAGFAPARASRKTAWESNKSIVRPNDVDSSTTGRQPRPSTKPELQVQEFAPAPAPPWANDMAQKADSPRSAVANTPAKLPLNAALSAVPPQSKTMLRFPQTMTEMAPKFSPPAPAPFLPSNDRKINRLPEPKAVSLTQHQSHRKISAAKYIGDTSHLPKNAQGQTQSTKPAPAPNSGLPSPLTPRNPPRMIQPRQPQQTLPRATNNRPLPFSSANQSAGGTLWQKPKAIWRPPIRSNTPNNIGVSGQTRPAPALPNAPYVGHPGVRKSNVHSISG